MFHAMFHPLAANAATNTVPCQVTAEKVRVPTADPASFKKVHSFLFLFHCLLCGSMFLRLKNFFAEKFLLTPGSTLAVRMISCTITGSRRARYRLRWERGKRPLCQPDTLA